MKKSIGFLLSISIIAISFAAIFVKWSDAPATIISMYRMYFACILLLPMVWMKRSEIKKITNKEWFSLFMAGFFLALHFALWFGSLKLTSVASSTIILSLQPLIALLGGYLFFKEKTNVQTLGVIGLSIIGVSIVAWGDFTSRHEGAILGDLLSLLSVVAVVAYLLIGQRNVRQISHWIYSFTVFLFAGIHLTIYNLITDVPIFGYESREWGIFLLLAIFPTLAHVIFNYLLNFVNSATISISVLGEPVGATILAAWLLGEQVTALRIIGGLIVLTGVFIYLKMQNNQNVA